MRRGAVIPATFLASMLMTHDPAPLPLIVETVHTNTERVNDLFYDGRWIWVATDGGLERYGPDEDEASAVYRRGEGLDALAVLEIRADARVMQVRTPGHWCTYRPGGFRCTPTDEPLPPKRTGLGRYAGHEVTARLVVGERQWVGTAGAGLWRDEDPPMRLTARGQVCGNAISAIVEHEGDVWMASEEGALCRRTDGRFENVSSTFAQVRDLLSRGDALWIATDDGLHRTRDGRTFARVEGVALQDVRSLSADEDAVWAATPDVLHRLVPTGDAASWAFWLPAGARMLGKLALDADGRLWVATADRGLLLRDEMGTRVVRELAWVSRRVEDIARGDDGSMHIGTWGEGIVTLSPGRVPSGRHAARGLHVYDLHAADDALWVGAEEGAFVVNGAIAHALPDLPDQVVRAILPTRSAVFAATRGGLVVYRWANGKDVPGLGSR